METKRRIGGYMEMGKLPPQAIEEEKLILGVILSDNRHYLDIGDILGVEYFYHDAHQIIYKAIQDMFAAETPIDPITVTHELKKQGNLDMVGGAYYITMLSDIRVSVHIRELCAILTEKYMLREMIRLGQIMQQNAYNEAADPFILIPETLKELEIIQDAPERVRKATTFEDDLLVTVAKIEKASLSGHLAGITTGNSELDQLMGGWMAGELTILAARPGMGKTARALNFAKSAAKMGNMVLFFSLEMTKHSLHNRMIADQKNIYGDKLRKGNISEFDWSQINAAINEMSSLPIIIDDMAGRTINDIRRVSLKKKPKIIIIDYLQLIYGETSKDNRDQEIGKITRGLKRLAKELDVPIILLSQLNREVEKRTDRRPKLADLRDSGNIEQDADIVATLYRPNYYTPYDKREDFYQDVNEEEYEVAVEFILLKFREGESNTFKREKFYGAYSKFTEWGHQPTQPKEESIF